MNDIWKDSTTHMMASGRDGLARATATAGRCRPGINIEAFHIRLLGWVYFIVV